MVLPTGRLIAPRPLLIALHGFSSSGKALDSALHLRTVATYAKAARCRPAAPVSVLHIHGTADPVVSYDGGVILAPYPSAASTVRTWATYDGCNLSKGLRRSGRLDVNASIAGKETTSFSYSCPRGVEVTLWSVDGGTHSPSVSKGFSALVLDWLLRHKR